MHSHTLPAWTVSWRRALGGQERPSWRTPYRSMTDLRFLCPLFICPLHTRDLFRVVVIFRLVMEPLMDYETIITGAQSTINKMRPSKFVYFCKTFYMFQTGFPSIIMSSKLHIQRQVFFRPIPDAVCAVLSSWWWTEKPSETCIESYRNKYIEKRCILLVVYCEYISDAPTHER